ncbi:MAG: hypothetical protein WA093_01740 [Minisyncoccales bacterium]
MQMNIGAFLLLLVACSMSMPIVAGYDHYVCQPQSDHSNGFYVELPESVQMTPTNYTEMYLINQSTILLIESEEEKKKILVESVPVTTIIYNDTVESAVFKGASGNAGIIESLYFPDGAPKAEAVQRAAIIKLQNLGNLKKKNYIINHYPAVFAGYNVIVYGIINPLSGHSGKMTQFRINDKEIVSVVLDDAYFESVNNTIENRGCPAG